MSTRVTPEHAERTIISRCPSCGCDKNEFRHQGAGWYLCIRCYHWFRIETWLDDDDAKPEGL